MIAPSARWSVCVQAASPVSTWSPPTTTWTVNRTAIESARRTTSGRARCVRQAASAVAHTMTPTTAATQRWSTWALLASVSGGKSGAVHQRPVGEHDHCDVAVTFEPNSSSA